MVITVDRFLISWRLIGGGGRGAEEDNLVAATELTLDHNQLSFEQPFMCLICWDRKWGETTQWKLNWFAGGRDLRERNLPIHNFILSISLPCNNSTAKYVAKSHVNSTIVAKNKTRAHLDVLFQLSLPETLQGGIGTDMEDVDLAGLELSIPGLRGNFCMFCIVFFYFYRCIWGLIYWSRCL